MLAVTDSLANCLSMVLASVGRVAPQREGHNPTRFGHSNLYSSAKSGRSHTFRQLI